MCVCVCVCFVVVVFFVFLFVCFFVVFFLFLCRCCFCFILFLFCLFVFLCVFFFFFQKTGFDISCKLSRHRDASLINCYWYCQVKNHFIYLYHTLDRFGRRQTDKLTNVYRLDMSRKSTLH